MGSTSDTVSTEYVGLEHVPRTTYTALVKGAGPTGLASAAALARHGFNVTVVEKRQRRAAGDGRKNVVAIRPEALRNLDDLGALDYLIARDSLTDMTDGATVNQWDGNVFDWIPLFKRYPASKNGENGEYEIPGKITDQIPSSFVHLGDLEDALLDLCEKNKVKVIHGATVRLECVDDRPSGNSRYVARLAVLDHLMDGQYDKGTRDDLMTPDLIVCASGKNDIALASELGFRRHIGVKLDETCLPPPDAESNPSLSDIDSNSSSIIATDPRALHLGEDGEIESQYYSVFAVRHPEMHRSKPESTNGAITHVIRKDGTGTPPQPLTEITMGHKDVTHFIIHLPRDLEFAPDNQPILEKYVTDRVNVKLDTDYTSVKDMQLRDAIVVGAPLAPVLVETTTAPKYVFGSNVILVGDAAMSCSPASGVGADIGMTVDSKNVGILAEDLVRSAQRGGDGMRDWDKALDRFHRRKAEAAVIWSQASRMFYITGQEAGDILRQIKRVHETAMTEN